MCVCVCVYIKSRPSYMKQCGAVVPVKLLFIYNKTYLSEGRILFQFQILSYLIHGNSLIPCKPVHIVTA